MAKPSLAGLSGDEYKKAKAEYMREYRKENPEAFRKIDIKKKFGLSWETYSELVEKQGNCCAICKQPETKLDYRTKKVLNLSVYHCHDTWKIRGLLCADCNRALGMFQDNPEILQNAIMYLKEN